MYTRSTLISLNNFFLLLSLSKREKKKGLPHWIRHFVVLCGERQAILPDPLQKRRQVFVDIIYDRSLFVRTLDGSKQNDLELQGADIINVILVLPFFFFE